MSKGASTVLFKHCTDPSLTSLSPRVDYVKEKLVRETQITTELTYKALPGSSPETEVLQIWLKDNMPYKYIASHFTTALLSRLINDNMFPK